MEEKSIEEQIGIQGRKFTVPYALYRCHGFVSAPLAERTGFTEEDLELFWNALINLFEHDHSAARGQMASRKLIVFKHDSRMGKAPSHQLFDLVSVSRSCDIEKPPRSFSDYKIEIDKTKVPTGVRLEEKI